MTTERIEELRRAISEITRRECVSRDEKYLVRRLADLRKRPSGYSGARPDHAIPVTVSMISSRLSMLDDICQELSMSRSEVMRRALDMYAMDHGRKDEVESIQRTEAKLNG